MISYHVNPHFKVPVGLHAYDNISIECVAGMGALHQEHAELAFMMHYHLGNHSRQGKQGGDVPA
jgi:hypothetical protein